MLQIRHSASVSRSTFSTFLLQLLSLLFLFTSLSIFLSNFPLHFFSLFFLYFLNFLSLLSSRYIFLFHLILALSLSIYSQFYSHSWWNHKSLIKIYLECFFFLKHAYRDIFCYLSFSKKTQCQTSPSLLRLNGVSQSSNSLCIFFET